MTVFESTNRITSPYGYRKYRNSAGKTVKEMHRGIDIVCTEFAGQSVAKRAWTVREVTGGTVLHVTYDAARGNYVDVQTEPGVFERYQHLARVDVHIGQKLTQGMVIGLAGSTGNSTGVHLHFGVYRGGTTEQCAVNPEAWLGLPNKAGIYAGSDTLDIPKSGVFMENGIDVSKFQEHVDFGKVKAAGNAFVIVRAMSSNDSGKYIDPFFEENVRGAKVAGLKIGLYLYSYATSIAEIQDEVDFLLDSDQLRRLRSDGICFDYPLYIDYEDKINLHGTTRQQRTDIVRAGMVRLRDAGYYPGFYTYHGYMSNFDVAKHIHDGYPFWYARYPLAPEPDKNPSIGLGIEVGTWQYCSDGIVSGVTTPCDCNRSYTDYASIIRESGLNGYAAPEVSKKGMLLHVIGENCEYFDAMDTGKPNGKLAKDTQYEVLTLSGIDTILTLNGAIFSGPWCKFKLANGEEYYCLALSDRAEITDASVIKRHVIAIDATNIHSGPDNSFGVVGLLNQDRTATLVEINNHHGYIAGKGWVNLAKTKEV